MNKTEWFPMVTRGDLNDPTSGVEHSFDDLASYIFVALCSFLCFQTLYYSTRIFFSRHLEFNSIVFRLF